MMDPTFELLSSSNVIVAGIECDGHFCVGVSENAAVWKVELLRLGNTICKQTLKDQPDTSTCLKLLDESLGPVLPDDADITSPVAPGVVVYSIGTTKVISESKVNFRNDSQHTMKAIMEINADVVKGRKVVVLKCTDDANVAHQSFWKRNPHLQAGTITANFENGTYMLICKPEHHSVRCIGQAHSITNDASARAKETDFKEIFKLFTEARLGVSNMAMQATVAPDDRVTYKSLTAWLKALLSLVD
jgi:hypothetical protein